MKFRIALVMCVMIGSGVSVFSGSPESYAEMIRNPRSIDQLVEAINTLSYNKNKSCFWDYVKYLNYTFADENSEGSARVRKAAAEALGRLQDDRAISHLADRYKKETKDSVKASIVFALSRYQGAESLAVMKDGLASTNDDVRYYALMGAVHLQMKDAVPQIKTFLAGEKDEPMKVTLSYALLALGDEPDVHTNFLLKGLVNNDPVVRFRAADYLARLEIDSAEKDIRKAWSIENRWWVKSEMERAIGLLSEVRQRKRAEVELAPFKTITNPTANTTTPSKETPTSDTKPAQTK